MGSLSAGLGSGEYVQIYRDGSIVGTATVTGTSWSYLDSNLTNGSTYGYAARVMDAVGNSGTISSAFTLSLDNTPPTQAVYLGLIYDDSAPNTGTLAVGQAATDDNTPTFNGTLSAALGVGEFVQAYASGTAIGTAAVSGTGWSFTPNALADGTYNFTFQVQDQAGNASATSSVRTLSIQASIQTPSIDYVDDDVQPFTGSISSGGYTNDTVFTLHGSLVSPLAQGEYISIRLGGSQVATAIVSGTSWYATYPPVGYEAAGRYIFRAVVVTAQGVAGYNSSEFVITVDSTAPSVTASIQNVLDDASPLTGTLSSGAWTNDTSLLLSGTLSGSLATVVGAAFANEYLQILRNGTVIGTATLSGTSWTYADSGLADGTYYYTARAFDAAGNAGTASSAFTINIDSSAPTQSATISYAVDDQGTSVGNLTSMSLTDDLSPTLTGTISSTLQGGEFVEIMRDGIAIGSATVTGTGWTFTDSALSDGNHAYTAHVASLVGLKGADSASFSLTVLPNYTISGHTFTFGAGSHTLDLTTIPDGVVSGIEIIDIGGTGANTIKLNEHDVLDLSSSTDVVRIMGTSDDAVQVPGGVHFTQTGTGYTGFGDGVTYKIYFNSTNGSYLYIDEDIANVVLI